jgi:hypothetical protein
LQSEQSKCIERTESDTKQSRLSSEGLSHELSEKGRRREFMESASACGYYEDEFEITIIDWEKWYPILHCFLCNEMGR